jgi:anti-anti-sigma regulatory factor
MTSTSANPTRRFAYRYGNPAAECDGAYMRAQCRQLATVVTISGDVDATNIDRVSNYAQRFVLAEKPFVLDLSGVHTFSPQAVSLLRTVDQACGSIGVQWCLVPAEPVRRVLSALGDHAACTVADSVPDALNHFFDDMLARRRLLPLLNKTA